MCCLVTILLLLGPRIALVVWWLMDTAPFKVAFNTNLPFHLPWPFWVWPLIGGIFVPWTTLAYLVVAPQGVVGLEWVLLGAALLLDLGAHVGGGYRHRELLPRYRS